MFKVLRTSGLIKEISTHSVSIQRLNFWMCPILPFNFRMLTEFVLIFFIKQDVRKTLTITNLVVYLLLMFLDYSDSYKIEQKSFIIFIFSNNTLAFFVKFYFLHECLQKFSIVKKFQTLNYIWSEKLVYATLVICRMNVCSC